MRLIFAMMMEKQMEEGRFLRAQVAIAEREDNWQVIWEEDGAAGAPEVWFEGASWEEMLTSFRYGSAVKMGEGFVPLVDGVLEDRNAQQRGGSKLSYLQCFGELYANEELFEELRSWRRRKAREHRKAAYLVSTNRMLRMISAFVPHHQEELLQIPGWGEAKHSAYGEEVLELTRSFEQPTAFPLDWVQEVLNPTVYTQWLYKQKEQKFKEELDRQQEKRAILDGAGRGLSLSELETTLELGRRELIERMEQLHLEGYDMEPLIQQELSLVPDEELRKIRETLIAVGDRYLKPILSQVYKEEELKEQQLGQLYDRLRLARIRFRQEQSNSQAI